MLCEEVNDTTASLVVAQLLYLEAQDPDKDISLYINSPGGSVTAGMAIYDTMNYIKCDVSHHLHRHGGVHGCVPAVRRRKGQALSRCPTAEIMIHQPLRRRAGSGDRHGRFTPQRILRDHKERLNAHPGRATPASRSRPIARDTERDNFMTARGGCRVRPDRQGFR